MIHHKKRKIPPPKRLTPVQELYLELLKYKFELVSVERHGNLITVKTQLNPGYECAHHLLVPKV